MAWVVFVTQGGKNTVSEAPVAQALWVLMCMSMFPSMPNTLQSLVYLANLIPIDN